MHTTGPAIETGPVKCPSGRRAAHTGGRMTATAPNPAPPAGAAPPVDPAARVFSRSVLISGIRCTLAYIVFPWILPILGVASDVGPVIGIVVGLVAIGFNVASIRRFWVADHRWKWWISAINVTVIGMLCVLLALDVSSLVG